MLATDIKIDLNGCIERALNAAAPDGAARQRGKDVFWAELHNGSIGQALRKALDASAPDGDSWLQGETAFMEGFSDTWRRRSSTARKSVGTATSRAKSATVKALGPKRKH